MTKNYEREINNLAHDKTRLLAEVDDLGRECSVLGLKLRDNENLYNRDRANLENIIEKLKDDLEMNQMNFIREKDKTNFLATDYEKELAHLRGENTNLLSVVNENEVLSREVRNLRELLLESSHEMEKCKEEFLRMGKERDCLLLRVRELGGENDILHRIKVEREEEARGWRETYYMSRPHY